MTPAPRITRNACTAVPAPPPFAIEAIRTRGTYWPAIVRLYGAHGAADLRPADAYHLGTQLIAAAAIAEGRLDAADSQAILHAADASIGTQAREAYCAQLRASLNTPAASTAAA